jgi:hypothetical protein
VEDPLPLLTASTTKKYHAMIRDMADCYAMVDCYIQYPGECPIISDALKSRVQKAPLLARLARKAPSQQWAEWAASGALKRVPKSLLPDPIFSSAAVSTVFPPLLVLGFGGMGFSYEFLRDAFLPEGWLCVVLGGVKDEDLASTRCKSIVGRWEKWESRFFAAAGDVFPPDVVNAATAMIGKVSLIYQFSAILLIINLRAFCYLTCFMKCSVIIIFCLHKVFCLSRPSSVPFVWLLESRLYVLEKPMRGFRETATGYRNPSPGFETCHGVLRSCFWVSETRHRLLGSCLKGFQNAVMDSSNPSLGF